MKHVNFRYITKLVLLFLMISGIVTFLCNFFINGKITWSLYILSSIIYLSTQVSFLYFKKKIIPAVFNLLGLEFLLFTIAYLNNGLNWYLYLVLPNIFIVWIIYILHLQVVLMKQNLKDYSLLN